MRYVYIVRHGETTWNAERRWSGRADPPLSTLGRKQALEACDSLALLDFNAVTSSMLLRARETAQIIADHLQIPLIPPIEGIEERDIGVISGMTSPEIEKKYPGLLDPWRQGNPFDPPGAEKWKDFAGRVLSSLHGIPSGRTLVVGHEGVLRVIAEHLRELVRDHRNLEGRWICVSEEGHLLQDDPKPDRVVEPNRMA